MTRPARLLQLHGAIVDLIYRVEAVPRPGTEAIVSGFDIAAGGGFNAMAAARRSGLDVTYVGAVGAGPLGSVVLDALAAEGIEMLRPRDLLRDQGCCTVMVDRSGERTFVAADGAEGHVSDLDLRRFDPAQYGWCLLSGYTLYYDGSREALTRWLLSDAFIPSLVFDPGPVIASVQGGALRSALSRAAWVSANATEAAILVGSSDPMTAARRLAEGRAGAVVRNGAGGCAVAWDGQAQAIPAHPVATVDSNGAGDTHVGAFIASLARGLSPTDAACYANMAAALSTTRHGPATAPDRATVEQALRLKMAG